MPMQPFAHDDEHGSTVDYWDAFPVTIDPDEVPLILTDTELDMLDADIDTYVSDDGLELPDWFAPADATPPF